LNIEFRNIVIDHHGKGIFFLSYGNGIYYYTNKTLYKVPEDKIIFKTAHDILFGRNNYIYIPTNSGLVCTEYTAFLQNILSGSAKTVYVYFTKENGLFTNEFNGGTNHSHIYDKKNGIFYMSTIEGICSFNEHNLLYEFPRNDIYINSTVVDNTKNLGFVSPNSFFKEIIYEVVTPDFSNTQTLQLEYRILPADSTWKHLIDNNKIILSNLEPNNYTIEIRYRKGFRNNDYIIKEFTLIVKPRWYQTVLFKVSLFVLILLLVYAIILVRTSYIKRQNLLLKEKIIESNLELYNNVAELEESLEKNELLLSILTHDIKNPIHFTQRLSANILDDWETLSEKEIKNYIGVIDKSLIKLNTLIFDFLNWAKIVKPNKFFVEQNQEIAVYTF